MYDTTTFRFIVRIWLEETAEEAGQALWRGHVTHVPSGVRQHFHRLDELCSFIEEYLAKVDSGVRRTDE